VINTISYVYRKQELLQSPLNDITEDIILLFTWHWYENLYFCIHWTEHSVYCQEFSYFIYFGSEMCV